MGELQISLSGEEKREEGIIALIHIESTVAYHKNMSMKNQTVAEKGGM